MQLIFAAQNKFLLLSGATIRDHMSETAKQVAGVTDASKDLLVDRQDNVLRLTINRAHRRNALTEEVMNELAKEIGEASRDTSLRAIVLTGAGDKAFCAGADLKPGDTPFRPDFSRLTLPLANLARAAHACHLPIIGRINGLCLAGGMGLFGMCDLAIATEDARFGMPEVKIGIFPMQILTLLRDLIPPRYLNEMCMTGRPITAQTAFSLGLLNQVVPAAELDSAVDTLVGEIVGVSPIAVRRGKYAMRAVESMSFHEMMAFTETAISPMIQTEDAREGLAAFNDRRPPRWTGR
jgi:enoyl-CoA hydratase/carnithine racemase